MHAYHADVTEGITTRQIGSGFTGVGWGKGMAHTSAGHIIGNLWLCKTGSSNQIYFDCFNNQDTVLSAF